MSTTTPFPPQSGLRIPILMYHNIAALPRGAQRHRGLYVRPAAFARQMALMKWLGYRGLSMGDAVPYLRGERTGRVAVITLDDGYVDNLDAALPVLQRHGFTATCYAVSGELGRHNRWDTGRLGVEKPLMTPSQLRAWRDGGMEVGAHSRTHPRLTQCTDAQLRDEILGSRRELEDVLGQPVTQFCYPYGDHDDRVVAMTREAGFHDATTVKRGRAVPGTDPWRWPRVPVVRQHTLAHFAARLLTAYEDRRG